MKSELIQIHWTFSSLLDVALAYDSCWGMQFNVVKVKHLCNNQTKWSNKNLSEAFTRNEYANVYNFIILKYAAFNQRKQWILVC